MHYVHTHTYNTQCMHDYLNKMWILILFTFHQFSHYKLAFLLRVRFHWRICQIHGRHLNENAIIIDWFNVEIKCWFWYWWITKYWDGKRTHTILHTRTHSPTHTHTHTHTRSHTSRPCIPWKLCLHLLKASLFHLIGNDFNTIPAMTNTLHIHTCANYPSSISSFLLSITAVCLSKKYLSIKLYNNDKTNKSFLLQVANIAQSFVVVAAVVRRTLPQRILLWFHN